MPYCPWTLTCSQAHADKRLRAASSTVGEAVVQRLLAYALFLMGAKREEIAAQLSMPLGTLLSLLTRIGQHGVAAIEDRRFRHSAFAPPLPPTVPPPSVAVSSSTVQITMGSPAITVSIPQRNRLQTKVVLLTLLDSGVLERAQVARLLGYSATHVARLARHGPMPRRWWTSVTGNSTTTASPPTSRRNSCSSSPSTCSPGVTPPARSWSPSCRSAVRSTSPPGPCATTWSAWDGHASSSRCPSCWRN